MEQIRLGGTEKYTQTKFGWTTLQQVQRSLSTIAMWRNSISPLTLWSMTRQKQSPICCNTTRDRVIANVACECLVHLIRDLNDDLWKNPFDDELEEFVAAVRTGEMFGPPTHTVHRRNVHCLIQASDGELQRGQR